MRSSTQLDLPAGPRRSLEQHRGPSGAGWRSLHLFALLLGLGGLVCALLLPLAPVWVQRTTVHWPAEQPVSTTAFFAPYRPAEFRAEFDCAPLRTGLARPGNTTVFATVPPRSGRDGLVLTASGGGLRLVLGQRQLELPPPTGDCRLEVVSRDRGSAVTFNGDRTELPGVLPPEVFVFTTDLPPFAAGGIAVTARTYSWFATSPTAVKSVLVAVAAVSAAGSLVLLAVLAPAGRHRLRRPAVGVTDAGVAAVLAGWLFIGPLTDDDGFAMMTVRNHDADGDIGNYYRWFNASEAPFTLVQHVMRLVAAGGLDPAWLRVPSVLAGFCTWLLVSRGIVGPLCPGARRRVLRPTTAVFFLACWLPFGLGIRPEAFVALGTAAVTAALLKAERSRAHLWWLGVAAVATGLTVAITPSGVGAALVVCVFAPRIVRLLSRPGPAAQWLVVSARVALLCCAGAVGVVAMFADSTWNGVKQASLIHHEFGPSLGWYQEVNRYAALLGPGSWGSAGKRVAVLLVLVALPLATACALRQLHHRARMPRVPLLAGATGALFAALWLSPSKWTHHFGVLAGLGPALLAVTVVLLVRAGRRTRPPQQVRVLGVVGGCGAAVAAALAFTGPNSWWLHSDIAMPWSDTPVRPLDKPLLWLGIGAVTTLAVLLLTTRHDRSERTGAEGLVWTSAPAAVLATAALASVVVLLGSFSAAPLRMGDRFSVARANWLTARGQGCGLEDEVEVLPLASQLRPVEGTAQLNGFAEGGRPPAEPELRSSGPGQPLRPPGGAVRGIRAAEEVWTSRATGSGTTGSLTTQWFGLPRLRDSQLLAVWVNGRISPGNRLTVEFGTGSGGPVRLVGARELRDPPPVDLPYDDPQHGRNPGWRSFGHWRLLTVPAAQIPAGADLVRLRAADNTVDPQGYLEVSSPVVRDAVPLSRVLDGQRPVLIDWPVSFLYPCRTEYPRVSGGTAQSPLLLVTTPTGERSMAFDPNVGGVFAGVPLVSHRYELPSRLRDAPGVPWGRVYAVSYHHARDAYRTTQHRQQIGGAAGDPGYPFPGT